jgi:hypothetical protein
MLNGTLSRPSTFPSDDKKFQIQNPKQCQNTKFKTGQCLGNSRIGIYLGFACLLVGREIGIWNL